jgi:hypothetical protein
VEGDGPLEVGDLQVRVTDADCGFDGSGGHGGSIARDVHYGALE